MYHTAGYDSPIGPLTLASDGQGLTGLWIQGQKYFGLPADARPAEDLPLFGLVRTWLDRYFAGERPDTSSLPLAPPGSPYQQEVWRLLGQIPYGQTTTYGALAQQLGRASGASRAVGGAVGRNPISIVIPCHRVLGAGGRLTGYAGGIERKRWLLAHEGLDVSLLR